LVAFSGSSPGKLVEYGLSACLPEPCDGAYLFMSQRLFINIQVHLSPYAGQTVLGYIMCWLNLFGIYHVRKPVQ
jgi:hypothetical protein